MHKTKVSFMLSVTTVLLGISFALPSFAEKPTESPQKPKSRAEHIEEIKAEKRSISFAFYGKVVDLDDNPVEGAQVTLRMRYSPLLPLMNDQKEIRLITDNQGLFMLGENGFLLELDSISKAGYEYRFQYNPKRSFRFHNNEKKAHLGQLLEQPIVFKIRKKGLPTLVLGANANFRLYPDGDQVFFDLLWQQWAYPKGFFSASGKCKGWRPDLKISLEGKPKNWQLVLEPLDADTGIKVDEHELYEAPEEGYRTKAVIPFVGFEEGGEFNTYAYIKGRGDQFYSRLHLQVSVENKTNPEKRFARLDVDYRTNPEGKRNFEASSDLGWQYLEDVRSGKRRPYGYDAEAKGLTMEDVRKLLGK